MGLRKVKDLNAARNAVDITTLVLTEEGTSVFLFHAWQLCLRSRLGLQLGEPIRSGAIPRLCPGYQVPMDDMGDHALCCPKLGTYARHNDLGNQFAALCTDIGLRVEREVSPHGTSSRPADVLLHGLDSSSPLAVDFTVVHPLLMSQNLAEVHPGKLTKMAERKKTREQFAKCHKAGWEFCPFIVETQGTWGGHARHLMQRIICLWALKKGCSKSEAVVSCTGPISTAVLRGVGRQLERGFRGKGARIVEPTGHLCCL